MNNSRKTWLKLKILDDIIKLYTIIAWLKNKECRNHDNRSRPQSRERQTDRHTNEMLNARYKTEISICSVNNDSSRF